MAEQKTKPTTVDVQAFLAGVADEQQRAECQVVLDLMAEATGAPAVMWGPSIVGFGSYHYRYASGREGDAPITGFAPRGRNLVLYVMDDSDDIAALLSRLGKHSTGKACLYLKSLKDVDMDVLRQIVNASVEHTRATYQVA